MSIGTDYEMFLDVSGRVVPASERMNLGDKWGTHVKLKSGTMHRDNVMVELCSMPADEASAFADNCIRLITEAETCLAVDRGLKGAKLLANPTQGFTPAELDTPEGKELGCDADFLAELGESVERARICAATMGNIRCAGGHVHISYGCTDKIPPAIAVGFCDIALGGLELGMGSQGPRREHYGIAGLHRRKWYGMIPGVEYRTVSNLWLRKREYAEAIGTNALTLERLFNTESVERLSTVWERLIKPGAIRAYLRGELKFAAAALLTQLANEFPQQAWVTEVSHDTV